MPLSEEGGSARYIDFVDEGRISQIGSSASQQAIVQAIRDSIIQEVDARVAEKTDELWYRGKQMLGQIQEKHRQRIANLQDEVQRCNANCAALEKDNAKLKQALAGLAARFSGLGTIFNSGEEFTGIVGGACPGTPAEPAAVVAALPQVYAATANAPGREGFAAPRTPPMEAAALSPVCGGAPGALPAVPDFPFPGSVTPSTAPPSPGGQLSLAEVLCPQTPQRTPLSLATSLTPSQFEVHSPFTVHGGAPATGIFSFTLRKADGADLGLNVTPQHIDKVLQVDGVRPDGAVQAWNRQCAGSPSAEKAVMKGDKIISVNNIVYDAMRMLEECQNKQLLKLTIVRGDGPLPVPLPQANSARAATPLRADASVFVPRSAEDTFVEACELVAGSGVAAPARAMERV